MIFYGECSILNNTVASEEIYENWGIIKVVVVKTFLSLEKKAYQMKVM